ncbi:uncharacterized protein LOC131691298 [Topomyia yanbarensis]|uniref:uncharacterized protein LOC131691298 n=1 Tax=Topomyia yanbarensis TaxID=2498891 RepID=UPI00273C66DD|nr:uncharacterized protein LOC131691298 [Topomyia yanbarensis]
MNENLSKICRICLTEGSRNIFQKTVRHDALYNVSSLNRIMEKLRYVTLLKIDEMENLPPMICDLCIVQLNVAYNFKRQATESDTKLRQYLIENGIDIMKDPLSILPSNQQNSSLVPVRRRINSVSSSSVMESTSNGQSLVRLVPFRIKVESPETVEQSSEADVLSNSPISPLSTATAPVQAAEDAATDIVNGALEKNQPNSIVVDSSPTSSKGSLVSNGRDSTMVVIDSRNVNLQGDEDYVQNILGSSGNTSTDTDQTSEVVHVQAESPAKVVESVKQTKKSSHDRKKLSSHERLQLLLSSLSIDMVNGSSTTKSKLRIHARNKDAQNQGKKKSKDISTKKVHLRMTRRHSLDSVQLRRVQNPKRKISPSMKADQSPQRKRPTRETTSTLISPRKLRTLREKFRQERDQLKHSTPNGAGQKESKRRRTFAEMMSGLGGKLVRGDKAPCC